jgi:CDP-diacylglycerol--glycerol-3-phosphate 3-phosphatidyltransferase
MFDKHLRSRVEPRLRPVGHNLRRTGVRADHLTAFGLVMAAGTAVAIGAGALRLGFALGVLATVPDVFDGAVAKATGTASKRGAFFDSVADRIADALFLGGVAWYLATTESGPVVLLPVAVMALSMVISYERAKAESLGFEAKGGLMERAERSIALGVGLLFEFLLVPILWVMLVLSLVTVVQRFVSVWRQATAEMARPPAPTRDRWRARRSSRRTERGAWRRYRERWVENRARWTERERPPRRGPGV